MGINVSKEGPGGGNFGDVRHIFGLPVITTRDGVITAHVKELLVEPSLGKVVGLVVASRSFLPGTKFLPFSEIKALSEKVVLIDSKDALKKPEQALELLELFKKGPRLLGQKVIAEDGSYLGQMVSFSLNPATGEIADLIIAPGVFRLGRKYKLNSSYIITIGKDAIVVKREGVKAQIPLPGKTSVPYAKIKESLAHYSKALLKKRDD